jgi:hypothetical protein
MRGEKSLRAYSKPLPMPKTSRLDWECDDSSGDLIVELLNAREHLAIITDSQARGLRAVDKRFFDSQLVGVNRKGVYRA